MSNYLLDSSAVLALVRNEPGAESVEAVLAHSCLHTTHLAEIARKLRSLDLSLQEIEIMITDLQIPFSRI